jgi:hypothetical protein
MNSLQMAIKMRETSRTFEMAPIAGRGLNVVQESVCVDSDEETHYVCVCDEKTALPLCMHFQGPCVCMCVCACVCARVITQKRSHSTTLSVRPL